ncbi:sensor histidine kinase [Caproiciproducens sp. NJN-50]|uniref:sensor histidine kinase n=1 Tax=Acutalibacteraceae TaxID=3082771 RepID=UPI000FFE03D1|nr:MULTISPECIES: HAMP domain-containing sensor histidine kinase [Acutalibacteraceae]QAT49222.1 sensor histidine kinase [Caproiciproducens sp. NJN-50]
MRSETQGRGNPAPEDHTKPSIVFRLNTVFFFELLGIFLVLDLLFGASLLIAAAGHAERAAGLAVYAVEQEGLRDSDGPVIFSEGGVTLEKSGAAPEGLRVPALAGRLFFDESLSGERYFAVPRTSPLFRKLDGLVYRLYQSTGDVVSVDLSKEIGLGETILIIFLAAELMMLLFGVRKRSRRIRKTLRPIAELAETARRLNQSRPFTPEEIEALAGKINGINASRLDTRIAVSGTQEELRNLAAAINSMLDRINESYRAQVRFVSDASHELRTPIAVIQGYVSLLDRWGKHDEKALQESIEAIKSETDNMKQLVEQLLFLARGDNNTMILQKERFDVSALAQQVYRETKMIDGGHGYFLRAEPALIDADEALIKQAMRILVDNAVKYTPAGGTIRISAVSSGEEVRVTVQDDGIGIPAEALPRVFDRFFRTDASRARATGGAGLGLSIARWIAERHGGHMEVLSREAIGSRISLVLPAAKEERTEGKEEKEPEAGVRK